MEGSREMASRGYPVKIDLQPLEDGTLVACQDDTVDRTMLNIGSGQVSSKTPRQWRDARIKPVVDGGMTGTPIFFNDWINELGGRHFLFIDIKPNASAYVQKIVNEVKRRRLQKSVVLQTFKYEDAEDIAQQGLTVLYGHHSNLPPESPEMISRAGIWGFSTSTITSDEEREAMKAVGLRVFVYVVNDPDTADHLILSDSVDGMYSDDPEFTAERIVERTTDSFADGYLSAGMRFYVENAPETTLDHYSLSGNALCLPSDPNMTQYAVPYVTIPELSPRGDNFRISVDIEIERASPVVHNTTASGSSCTRTRSTTTGYGETSPTAVKKGSLPLASGTGSWKRPSTSTGPPLSSSERALHILTGSSSLRQVGRECSVSCSRSTTGPSPCRPLLTGTGGRPTTRTHILVSCSD